jgi:hypothetical protein
MPTIRSVRSAASRLLGLAVVLAAFVVGTLQRIRDRWSR